MGAYILIIMLSTYNSDGGITVATAQFQTKELCAAAEKKVHEKSWGVFVQEAKTMCLPAQ
jgi:hypothetical protein